MKIHSSRKSTFSFDPVEVPIQRHPSSIQSDPVPGNFLYEREFMKARRKRSVCTQWSGQFEDKKDSFDSSKRDEEDKNEIPPSEKTKIQRFKSC